MPRIRVQVVLAGSQRSEVAEVELAVGALVREAVAASGLHVRHEGVTAQVCAVGIHGRTVTLDHRLADGDRVELYRALTADPRLARRLRAGQLKPRR